MKSAKVKVSPKVLRWARESLNLPKDIIVSHFAQKSKEKFKVNATLVDKMESDAGEEIAFTLLQELSNLYKRPLAIFFLDKPPVEAPLPKDRRTIDSDVHRILSPEAVLAIRRARYVQEIFLELTKELNISIKFPFRKFSTSDNPENMGSEFRDILNFPLEEQRKIRDPRGLFDALRLKLENVNVFTLKSSFPLEDARAFSLVDRIPYLILVNNKDGGYFGYSPKTFSLLHEFAHILLRESAICNDFSRSHQQIEKFCNEFAASFLVPTKYFMEVLPITRQLFDKNQIEGYLNSLRAIFKVSNEVLLRKFLSLSMIDDSFYKAKVKEWNDNYEKEKAEKGKKDKFIPAIAPGRRAISNNGKKFVEIVLNARGEGKITVDSAADYLGVSLKSFPEVEQLSTIPRRHA